MKARLVSEKAGRAHSSCQIMTLFLFCSFFPAFLVLSTWPMLAPAETSLTPHPGRLIVIRHKLGPTVHYKHTFKTDSIFSLSAENVLEKECTEKTPENSKFCDKLILGSYHIDKRWPGHKPSSSSQLTFDTHKDRAQQRSPCRHFRDLQ